MKPEKMRKIMLRGVMGMAHRKSYAFPLASGYIAQQCHDEQAVFAGNTELHETKAEKQKEP